MIGCCACGGVEGALARSVYPAKGMLLVPGVCACLTSLVMVTIAVRHGSTSRNRSGTGAPSARNREVSRAMKLKKIVTRVVCIGR